mmetsp:Transcript_29491/g.64826  ORF Transcript_29491/g.64826 Transcript_29491/m.64826 type:complete len:225 (-) Transcript_29491:254-928(-)
MGCLPVVRALPHGLGAVHAQDDLIFNGAQTCVVVPGGMVNLHVCDDGPCSGGLAISEGAVAAVEARHSLQRGTLAGSLAGEPGQLHHHATTEAVAHAHQLVLRGVVLQDSQRRRNSGPDQRCLRTGLHRSHSTLKIRAPIPLPVDIQGQRCIPLLRHLLRPHLLVLPEPHPLVGHEHSLRRGHPNRLGQPPLHHKVPHGVLHSARHHGNVRISSSHARWHRGLQ